MSERLTDADLERFERRIDQEFTGEAHLTSDEMRAVLAELRERRAQFNVTDGATWSALSFAREVLKEQRDAAILDAYRGRCESAVEILNKMLGGAS